MRYHVVIIITLFLLSCTTAKERKECVKRIGTGHSLNIENFSDFIKNVDIEDENLTDILWIIDGVPISGDIIVSTLDDKQYDILSIIKIDKSKLSHIYVNKDWSFALLISTNDCKNRNKR